MRPPALCFSFQSALAATLALMFAAAAGAQSAGELEANKLNELKVQLRRQLTLVCKTLGEEQFIDGDRQAASRSHETAAGSYR